MSSQKNNQPASPPKETVLVNNQGSKADQPPVEFPGGKPSSNTPPKEPLLFNPTQATKQEQSISAPTQPATNTSSSSINVPPPIPPKQATPPQVNQSASSSPPLKKSPFRFLFPFLIIIILGSIIFFAVTQIMQRLKPTDSSSKTSVQLVYWGLWEPPQIMESLFQEFQTNNPHIAITYQQQNSSDYRERLSSALQSGQGPDVFRYHHTWLPMLTNVLSPVPESIMTQAEFNSIFYPVTSQWLVGPQGPVGIPLMFDGLGLYYNRTIFDAAGLNPPTTWEELRRTAVQLTIKTTAGTIQRSGIALGTTSNVDNWSDIVGLMLLQNGADPAKPNTESGQGALTFYTIFNQRDQIWDDTLPNSTYAFAIEKAAMILAPSWRAHEILDINREINFAIAPVPQLPDTNTTWASFWVEGVSNSASREKQEAAWQLLKFMSSKEAMLQFYNRASQERLYGEPFSRIDLADQLIGDPYLGAYISTAPQSKSWFLSSRTFDNGINDRIIKYYEDAINSMNQGVAASQALETTEQGISQVLSQYGAQ